MAHIFSVRTAIAICLSAIIGDTLFAVTGIPIAQAGTNSIIAYILVGAVAVIIAMIFGELSSLMPKEKGLAYSYVTKTLGTELGFITGILLYVGYCTTISAVSFSFGGYALSILGISSIPIQIAIAACLIIFVSYLNMKGLKETARVSEMLVIVVILTSILFVGFAIMHSGFRANLAVSQAQSGFTPFEAALTTVVFGYAGFQTVVSLTNNVKGKGRGIAKAMIYSILISAVAYIWITFGLMLLVPPSQSVINAQPLYSALLYANSPFYVSVLVLVGSLIAIAASLVTLVLISSRLLYQMGIDGLLPKITRRYDGSKDIAANAIWISAVVEIAFLFSGSIYAMLSISNFGIIFSWLMAGLVLMNLRRRSRVGKFAIPYHPYTTVIAISGCLLFLFGLPSESLAIGIALILLLLVVYYTIAELKYRKIQRVKLFD